MAGFGVDQVFALVLMAIVFSLTLWLFYDLDKEHEARKRARRELLKRRVLVVPLPYDEDEEGLFWLWAAGLMDEEGSV